MPTDWGQNATWPRKQSWNCLNDGFGFPLHESHADYLKKLSISFGTSGNTSVVKSTVTFLLHKITALFEFILHIWGYGLIL